MAGDEKSPPIEVSQTGRRFQFSLGSLMVVVTGVSVLCGLAVCWPGVVIPAFLLAAGPIGGLVAMQRIELRYLGSAAVASGAVTCVLWAVCISVGVGLGGLDLFNADRFVPVVMSFLGAGIVGFYTGAFLGGATAVAASLLAMVWRWIPRLPED